MIEARLNISLHANQKIIHQSPARFKVVKAGKRFGKTKLAIYEICRHAGLTPNEIFWYVAPSFRQAKQIAWHELQWILPKQFVKRRLETELTVELINGSRIVLIGADNEDSLRGPRLGGVVFDECSFLKEHIWPAIISGQLLGSKTSFAYFISSPNPTGRNWYTRFWEDARARQANGDKEWAAFFYTIRDNPTLTTDEIDKLQNQISDDVWSLEYLAKESDLAGQLYHEFMPATHVGTYDGSCDQRHRWIDWGLSHPTAILYAQIDLKRTMVYVYEEFFKSGLVIRDICELNHKIADPKTIDREVIDPSANRRDPINGRSVKDEFQRYGIFCTDGDRRDRGYDILKMFFKKNLIRIHPSCKNLIYQLKNLQRGDKTGDDCPDALRYGVTYVHDTVFSGNILAQEFAKPEGPKVYPAYTRELNMGDQNLFPDQNKRQDSWVLDEIYAD